MQEVWVGSTMTPDLFPGGFKHLKVSLIEIFNDQVVQSDLFIPLVGGHLTLERVT